MEFVFGINFAFNLSTESFSQTKDRMRQFIGYLVDKGKNATHGNVKVFKPRSVQDLSVLYYVCQGPICVQTAPHAAPAV